MAVDPNDPRAPYLQVAGALRSAIQAGEYGPGALLPSLQDLAETHRVAVNTARSAVALLRDEGWVVVQHGKGTLVRSQPPAGPGESGGDRSDDGNERVWQAIAEIRRRLADVEQRLARGDEH